MNYFEPADRGQVKVHVEKGREKRTSRGAFAKLTTMARGRPAHHRRAAAARHDRRWGAAGHRRSPARRIQAHAPGGPPDAVRPLHAGGRGPPGGGGRQRRHGRVPRAPHGPLAVPTRSSYSSSRPGHRSTSNARTRASTTTMAPASSPANGWCRARTDIFVGWGSLAGRDFYVRQYRDMKIIPDHRPDRPGARPSSPPRAAPRWRGRTPAPATRWPSTPTSERVTSSPGP